MLSESDCACTKSELSLFESRPVQTVLEQAKWIDIHPLNNVQSGNSPIEFTISSSSEEYIDLNDTMLNLKCRVVKADGSAFIQADNQTVAPVNNIMHSLFSDVKLTVGNTQVEGGVHLYPYRAYMNNLLLFSKASKNEQLCASGYYKDTAGSMGPAAANKGYQNRLKLTSENKTIELCGPLCLDLCSQAKYILSQVPIHIKLTRAKPEFYLMRSGTDVKDNTARIVIDEATLYVRKVRVAPSQIMEHEKQLTVANALYPLQHTRMLSYSIPTGTQHYIKDGLFRGMLPKLVIFGMVDNTALNGEIGSNPFEFKHNNVNNIALYRDGITTPFRPLTPNFSNKQCVREYIAGLVQGLQLYNRDDSIDISLEDYAANGYTLFAFNLTPDLNITGHAQPYHEANLRLELSFGAALTSAINVVVMAIFDGKLEITRQREVIVDYRG
jgi:hypothetical protein